ESARRPRRRHCSSRQRWDRDHGDGARDQIVRPRRFTEFSCSDVRPLRVSREADARHRDDPRIQPGATLAPGSSWGRHVVERSAALGSGSRGPLRARSIVLALWHLAVRPAGWDGGAGDRRPRHVPGLRQGAATRTRAAGASTNQRTRPAVGAISWAGSWYGRQGPSNTCRRMGALATPVTRKATSAAALKVIGVRVTRHADTACTYSALTQHGLP